MVESIGLNGEFPCFRCGVCCTRYQVRVDLEEARHIATRLNVDWETFIREFTDSRWPGSDSVLIAQRNGACIFLERDLHTPVTRCAIYSFRPEDCRNWTPSPERTECLAGLRLWHLRINARNEIEGNKEDLKKFRDFLNSLPAV